MNVRRGMIQNSRVTFACLGALVVAVGLYLYFLNMSVVQVVMRIEHVQTQRDLSAEIASLEAQYIEAQHKVAARVAGLEGYRADAGKVFISRESSRLVLGGQ